MMKYRVEFYLILELEGLSPFDTGIIATMG